MAYPITIYVAYLVDSTGRLETQAVTGNQSTNKSDPTAVWLDGVEVLNRHKGEGWDTLMLVRFEPVVEREKRL